MLSFYLYGSVQSSWQRITLERYSKAFQLFWMWQDRMLEMVEVMEWKTSWEYDSGLVITTWKAVIKKIHVRIQHTVLSLVKLLEDMLTNKNQVLEVYISGLSSGQKFCIKKRDLSKSDLTSRIFRMRSKWASNFLHIASLSSKWCRLLQEVKQHLIVQVMPDNNNPDNKATLMRDHSQVAIIFSAVFGA